MAKVLLSTFLSVGFYKSRESECNKGAIHATPLLPRIASISIATQPALLSLAQPRCPSVSPVFSRLGSRSIQYGDCQDYVLIELGKEELFVDLEELRARLRNWLENWPGRSLPSNLAGFENLDDAVTYLVENACELDITDGSGTVQLFGVRL